MNKQYGPSLPSPLEIGGLSLPEAEKRREAGQENTPPRHATRTAGRIVRDNCLTLFNLVNVSLAALILVFGDIRNTLFLGVTVFSTCIGIAQELRAKFTIDRLSILNKAMVDVVRGGDLISIESTRIVLGDTLLLHAGDQVTADGVCTHCLGLRVNESLITGEADEIVKQPGDPVWSGSFVAVGSAYIRVTAVGSDSFAARLSAEAKQEKRKKSLIMLALGKIVKVLTIAIIPVGIVLYASKISGGLSVEEAVTGTAAALVGMIPQGLILLTNIAFAVGVINLGKHKAMVQTLSCLETLARVDTLCLDKTGTITNGDLSVAKVVPLNGYGEKEIEAFLASLLTATPDKNQTVVALKKEFLDARRDMAQPAPQEPVSIIPFSSARKYSGVEFADRTLLIGATAFVLPDDQELCRQAKELSKDGSRVLILAEGDGALQGAAFILLEDTIRDEAKDTFAYFREQGVAIKVISGDDPATVSGVAARAEIRNAGDSIDLSHYASGSVHDATTENGAPIVSRPDTEKTVFGRVSPYQKRALVRLMRENGHTVAMTGDGVNDVLALKEADCSVAMAGGSEAARSIADVVLLSSDFSSMISAVKEGRRVINNIEKVAALYLVKTIFSTLLALIYTLISDPYPFTPIQLTLISTLTIGIPSFFLTLRPNYQKVQGDLLSRIIVGAVPTALAVVLNILLARVIGDALHLTPADLSTICTFVTGVLGLALVCRVSLPMDSKRGFMLAGISIAFLSAFIFFPAVFEFTNLLGSLGLLAVILALISIIAVILLTELAKRLALPKGSAK